MRPDEWNIELVRLKKKLYELRTQANTEKLENSKQILNTKRDIARIKTIIRESQLKAGKK